MLIITFGNPEILKRQTSDQGFEEYVASNYSNKYLECDTCLVIFFTDCTQPATSNKHLSNISTSIFNINVELGTD